MPRSQQNYQEPSISATLLQNLVQLPPGCSRPLVEKYAKRASPLLQGIRGTSNCLADPELGPLSPDPCLPVAPGIVSG